ncbi:MAG: sulfatase [Gemmataceae bacterium]|nr:sulfatase [Gemmataceae bacterium]
MFSRQRSPIRLALAVALLLLAFPVAAGAQEKKTRPPNIVFILADDLGWADMGCQGSKYYETPNIDRLASQGMRFTSHYHSQNCAPTRACLMTGQYAPRTGVYTVGTLERGLAKDRKMVVPQNVVNLPLDRMTVAGALKQAGYATGMFGKWHLGQKGDYHPGRRGFDEAITSQGKHFDFATQPPVDYPKGTYLADWLTDKAVDFISRHKHEPFFLYVSHFGVHSPHHAKKELIAKFKDKQPAGGHRDPVYAAMIASIDESVGRIMARLDELNLTNDTVVIFSSDNGGVGGYEEIGGRGITSNLPLRGGKGMLYEGGVRVAFIVRWPGRTRPGRTSDVPTAHVDLFPTFLEIAGSKQRPKQALDGVSLVPLLRDPNAKLGRDAIFFHFPGYLEGYQKWRTAPVGFIRAGDWKLMEFYEDGRLELYNIKEDLGEKTNLAARMPERARALQARLAAWRQELNAAMPRLRTENDPPGQDGKKGKKAKKGEQTSEQPAESSPLTLPSPPAAGGEGEKSKPSPPAAGGEGRVRGQRVFTCGHSFHVFVPAILSDLAKKAGIKDHVAAGLSGIGGSRVIQHWNVAEEKNKAKEALRGGMVDVLTLSPIHLPDDGIEKFAKLALEHNPKVRITVQEFWLPFDIYDPTFKKRPKEVDHNAPTIAELRERHEPYFKSMNDHVRELNKKLGKEALFVVPVGQAVIALREKILAGAAPGLRMQSDLFTDPIGHARPPLQALAAYCHYAVIYRRSPVGLPMPAVLAKAKNAGWDEKLNRLLQELAWEAVTSHPLSGVKARAKPERTEQGACVCARAQCNPFLWGSPAGPTFPLLSLCPLQSVSPDALRRVCQSRLAVRC